MKNDSKGNNNSSDASETGASAKSENKSGKNTGNSSSGNKSSQGKNGSNAKGNNKSKESSGEATQQDTLQQMFEDLLKDTYNAEQQLVKALPKVAEACFDEELQNAIEDHWEQTKNHVKRIEKIFQIMRYNIESPTCAAMKGLIEESNEVIQEMEDGPVRDSALIIGSQKIEHYEMAAYGSLKALAEVLGYYRVADMLDRTLAEEEEADDILNEIAEYVNLEAIEVSMESESNA